MSALRKSPGTTVQWREIDSSTPRDREHFIILWCREDDSYWWASWQGGMWYGCDDFGLRRTSESYTPDYWCERPIFREPVDPDSAQQPWQPIETAPSHGEILLWWKHAGVGVGGWDDEGNGWRCEGDACVPKNQSDCTHWMPKPAPPSSQGASK